MEKLRQTLEVKRERAILVGVILPKIQGDNLRELSSLAHSAGAIVVDKVQQKLQTPHPGLYVGTGKAKQLKERVEKYEADVIIFDNDLAPNQIRELEKIVEIKVLDRSELILDIFATRAKTRQAKLQVAMAQLEYTYPRLSKMWSHLDSVAGAGGGTAAGAVGGIGTRGTGEQQLEIDRRLVHKRISELKSQLKKIDKRKLREIKGRREHFKVSLIGYTNTGKSTLLNILTDAGVPAQDKLFATLDTRTRKWTIDSAIEVLLSDTVGFVRDIPHHLVASFKATLEETVNANLLLHIIDISSDEAESQINSVNKVLKEIGCENKPIIPVLNKVDLLKSVEQLEMIKTIYPDAICLSAKNGSGIEELCQTVREKCCGQEIKVHVEAKHANGKVQSYARAKGRIISESYEEGFVSIEVILGKKQINELKKLKPSKLDVLSE